MPSVSSIPEVAVRKQRGSTLPETIVTLALLGLCATTVAAYSLDWIARERSRGEAYKLLAYMQSAKMEAVSRNHACLLTLDTASRTLSVVDTRGNTDPSDDAVVSQLTLDSGVTFANPVSGPGPVTLATGSGSSWYASFSPDGSVTAGAGFVSIRSGSRHDRVTLFAAGGTKLERWNGSAWVQGS